MAHSHMGQGRLSWRGISWRKPDRGFYLQMWENHKATPSPVHSERQCRYMELVNPKHFPPLAPVPGLFGRAPGDSFSFRKAVLITKATPMHAKSMTAFHGTGGVVVIVVWWREHSLSQFCSLLDQTT